MPAPRAFAELHALARRSARRADEAEDLLQSALLAALEAGRSDFTDAGNRRWIAGVIRNRARFDARTAARRRRREQRWIEDRTPAAHQDNERPAVDHLSPALRVTALLALSGHTRQEIGWLLNLSGDALRQRISQLKRALSRPEDGMDMTLSGQLAFGRIRRALLAPARKKDAFLASHDPDGHLFLVSRSQNSGLRQQGRE